MQGIKVNIEELLMAVQEIQARATKQYKVDIKIDGRNLIISAMDDNENIIEAILNDNGNMFAQFRHTERLVSMKRKGSL